MDDLETIYEEKKRALEKKKAQKEEVVEPSEDGCWWPWSMWCCGWWPWSCPEKPARVEAVDPMDKYRDAHKTLAEDVEGATRDVEEIVNDLKQCETELAEAKEELARLLEVSKKAKLKKDEADKKVKQTKSRELETEKEVLVLKK